EQTLLKAYREYPTTSPSFHLVASIESAAVHLRTRGKSAIKDVIRHSTDLRKAIMGEKLDLEFLDEVLPDLGDILEAGAYDRTKLTISTYRYPLAGYHIRDRLEHEFHIVAEKAGPNSLTFISTYQLPPTAAKKTGRAIGRILEGRKSRPAGPKAQPGGAFGGIGGELVLEPYQASRLTTEATSLVKPAES